MKMQIFGKNRKKRVTPRSTERELWKKLNDPELNDNQRKAILSELETVSRIRDGKSQVAGNWTKVLTGAAITAFVAWAGYGMDLFGVISQNRNSQDMARRSRY